VTQVTWDIERSEASAALHHGRRVPSSPTRAVWIHDVNRPALVLGSTQEDDVVDRGVAETLGVEVVRRRSGGGAVLLVPGEVVWIDVIVPEGDGLWDDDVGRSSLWLGDVWRSALTDLGVTGTAMHDGSLACGPLGRLVCFGAIGPGELSIQGRKLVGISQRRTRDAARYQCAVYRLWAPDLLADLLCLDDDARAVLAMAAMGVGREPDEIVDAFLRHLP
jgi:lipoate-protein ligase A